DDTETHYPLGRQMDRFTAGSMPGLLLLHGGGNVFARNLGPGESVLIKPTALLYCDSSVTLHIHIERPANQVTSFWSSWNQRAIWARAIGPGRVAMQSAFEHFEDTGKSLNSYSRGTRRSW